MSAATFRPRTVTEILDAAVVVFREQYGVLVTVTAAILSPALVLSVLVGDEYLGTVTLLQNLLSTIASGAVVLLVSERLLGQRVDAGQALRATAARGGALLLAALMRGLLVMVGLVLLIVPGLVFLARTFAMTMVVMLEGRTAGEAYERSRELARGHGRRILGALAVCTVLEVLAAFGTAMVFTALATMTGLPERVATLFTSVAVALTAPFSSVVVTLLYYDLRVRKEGFDLEMMALDLGALASDGSRDPATPSGVRVA